MATSSEERAVTVTTAEITQLEEHKWRSNQRRSFLTRTNGDGEDLSLPFVGVVVLVVAVGAAAALREQRTPPPLAVMVVMVVVVVMDSGKKGSRRKLDYNSLGKETVRAYVTFFAPMVLTVPARGYTNAHWPNPPGQQWW